MSTQVDGPLRSLRSADVAVPAHSGLWREMRRDRISQIVFVFVAVVVTLGYTIALPFAFTQRFTLRNWQFLDARYLGFSIAFGVLMAWLISLQVYAMRRMIRGRGGVIGSGATLSSLAPSLLCCSPIVPTVLGFFGLSGIGLSRTSVRVQHFFESKQNLILGGSLVLLAVATVWATRQVARASCLTDEGCPTPAEKEVRHD